MKLPFAIVGIASAVVAVMAHAQTPTDRPVVITQFVSPAIYITLPIEQRQFYVAGVLDYDMDFNRQTKTTFEACFKGVTIAQIAETVDQNVSKLEPAYRTSMPMAVHNIMVTDCTRRGFRVPH